MNLVGQAALDRFWYPVAASSDVADAPVAVRLLGRELVLWRGTGGAVAAAVDRCPHRFARLSCGWVDGDSIVCPYHGWEFSPSGAATRIPQLGADVPIPGRAHLAAVQALDRYGWVWVCTHADPLVPVPEIAEFDDPRWRAVAEPPSTWRCPAPMLVENNLDPAHIAFVHRASFGSPAEPTVPVADVERTATGLRTAYEVPVQSRPGEDRPTVRTTTTEVHGPLLMLIRIVYPDGLQHLMVKACTPLDDVTTLQLQTVMRTDTEADRPAAEIVAFDAQVWDEDRAVLETAHHDLPLDLTEQVHLRVDRPTIEYRRMLADLLHHPAHP